MLYAKFICVIWYINTFINTFWNIVQHNINADMRDYHQWKTGVRVDGLFGPLGMIGTVIGFFTGMVYPAVYEKMGLLENFIFTGIIKDRNLLQGYYLRADLFLFPSLYDASSIVQIEAASQSTPGIFLKDSATAATVTDNVNGFLSDYTVGAYSDKIIDVMKDQKLYEKVSKLS